MDFLDFFENIGIGLGLVVGVIIVLCLLLILSMLVPSLLVYFGGFLLFLIEILFIAAVIYFIGKFAKGFIKR